MSKRLTIASHVSPGLEFQLNDFTILMPEYTKSKNVLTYFMSYPTPKGPDNKILKFTPFTQTAFKKLMGKGKFKDYGQTYFNVKRVLETGGTLYFLSPKPDDATYANILILAKVKEEKVQLKNEDGELLFIGDDGQPSTIDNGNPLTEDKLLVKYVSKSLSDFSNADEFETLLESEYSEDKDENGYITIPVYAIRSLGRGKYGNKITTEMKRGDSEGIRYLYQSYRMSVYENDGMKDHENDYNAAIHEDSVNQFNTNEYAEVTINNSENASKLIRIQLSEFGIEKLSDLFMEKLTDKEKEDITAEKQVDILFGKNFKTNNDYDNITIESTSIDITNSIYLKNGSDGSIDTKLPKETRDKNITTLLTSVYSGEIDPNVENTLDYPFEMFVDANYTSEVKKAMHSLKNRREDCFCSFDLGIQSSCTNALTCRKETYGTIDDNMSSFHMFSVVVEDEDTKKDITLTGTYIMCGYAEHIAKSANMYGLGQPMAGPMWGNIRGVKQIFPIPENRDVADLLTKARLNYTQRVKEDGYQCLMLNRTSQYVDSELSFIEHCLIVNKMKRTVKRLLVDYYFSITDPTEEDPNAGLSNIEKRCQEILNQEYGVMVKEVRFLTSQTEEQRNRKIVGVDIDVVFRGHVERFLININIRREIK